MENRTKADELRAQAQELLRQADELVRTERIQFIADTRIKMKELGVTAEDLQEMRKPSRMAKNAPRFRCLLYTSPSPRDGATSRMPSSA